MMVNPAAAAFRRLSSNLVQELDDERQPLPSTPAVGGAGSSQQIKSKVSKRAASQGKKGSQGGKAGHQGNGGGTMPKGNTNNKGSSGSSDINTKNLFPNEALQYSEIVEAEKQQQKQQQQQKQKKKKKKTKYGAQSEDHQDNEHYEEGSIENVGEDPLAVEAEEVVLSSEQQQQQQQQQQQEQQHVEEQEEQEGVEELEEADVDEKDEAKFMDTEEKSVRKRIRTMRHSLQHVNFKEREAQARLEHKRMEIDQLIERVTATRGTPDESPQLSPPEKHAQVWIKRKEERERGFAGTGGTGTGGSKGTLFVKRRNSLGSTGVGVAARQQQQQQRQEENAGSGPVLGSDIFVIKTSHRTKSVTSLRAEEGTISTLPLTSASDADTTAHKKNKNNPEKQQQAQPSTPSRARFASFDHTLSASTNSSPNHNHNSNNKALFTRESSSAIQLRTQQERRIKQHHSLRKLVNETPSRRAANTRRYNSDRNLLNTTTINNNNNNNNNNNAIKTDELRSKFVRRASWNFDLNFKDKVDSTNSNGAGGAAAPALSSQAPLQEKTKTAPKIVASANIQRRRGSTGSTQSRVSIGTGFMSNNSGNNSNLGTNVDSNNSKNNDNNNSNGPMVMTTAHVPPSTELLAKYDLHPFPKTWLKSDPNLIRLRREASAKDWIAYDQFRSEVIAYESKVKGPLAKEGSAALRRLAEDMVTSLRQQEEQAAYIMSSAASILSTSDLMGAGSGRGASKGDKDLPHGATSWVQHSYTCMDVAKVVTNDEVDDKDDDDKGRKQRPRPKLRSIRLKATIFSPFALPRAIQVAHKYEDYGYGGANQQKDEEQDNGKKKKNLSLSAKWKFRTVQAQNGGMVSSSWIDLCSSECQWIDGTNSSAILEKTHEEGDDDDEGTDEIMGDRCNIDQSTITTIRQWLHGTSSDVSKNYLNGFDLMLLVFASAFTPLTPTMSSRNHQYRHISSSSSSIPVVGTNDDNRNDDHPNNNNEDGSVCSSTGPMKPQKNQPAVITPSSSLLYDRRIGWIWPNYEEGFEQAIESREQLVERGFLCPDEELTETSWLEHAVRVATGTMRPQDEFFRKNFP